MSEGSVRVEVLFDRVAGLDVHRDQVTACARVPRPSGRGRSSTVAEFSTTAGGLAALAEWLAGFGVTHVTMEATGIYWRPVFFALEAEFELMLVNAAHMRNVPGRKTDVADARWIAELAEHGLLRPSFVPPPDVRRLRNLTRYRKTLINERGRVIQRLEKNMQDAGVKLSSVTSTTLSVTFRRICEAMIDGERDPARLAALTKGRLRPKMGEIEQALVNHFDDHHAAVARCGLAHLDQIDLGIAEVSAVITQVIEPHRWALELLITIPGVSTRVAECLIAECGSDMGQFPTAGHLASWAGMCPGNNKSAGKTGPGTTRPGPIWLRQHLIEAAHAAARTRNNHLAARHRRIRARRGSKRATVATGHAILRAMWHMLSRREAFSNQGEDYFKVDSAAEARRLIKRLQLLGLDVTINPAA
ncbi:MAG: IS110 family transposase [Acidimicrobiales bacterium]